jgi:aminopeptidase N
VKRVIDREGHELPFAHRYHTLLVQIPPLQTGEADVRISVETEGEIFLDWKRRHDDSFFALLGAWWPLPTERRDNQHFSFDLDTRTRAPWRSVASGTEVALKEGHEWIETDSHGEASPFYINVLGGKYVTHEETIDGRKIRVYGYAMARKNVIEGLPKLAGAMIRFYSGALGPMPADDLDIVEVPEWGFGIAPFGMVLITSEAFKPRHDYNIDQYDARDDFNDYVVRGINARLAHEIAHQWFGHKAVPEREQDDWIAESLAEYWAGLAMGTMADPNKGVAGFPQMLARWRGEAPNCEATGPITSVNEMGGSQWYRDRYCLLYHRGPLVIHMLRTLIGDERFVSSSKLFLDRAAIGPASGDDFAKAVTDTVQSDVGWIVDDWIRQGGTPDLKVDYKVTTSSGGKHLAGTITESGSGGFKRLYVPFVLDVAGKSQARLVFVDQPQTEFDLDIPVSTTSVKVDPAKNNLVKYH